MPVLPLVASMTVCPGFSLPGPLRVLDHPKRQPVLDRAQRVEGLDLDEQIHVRRGELPDPDYRRIPNRLEDVREFASHVVPFISGRAGLTRPKSLTPASLPALAPRPADPKSAAKRRAPT